jgi:hypothetical protein
MYFRQVNAEAVENFVAGFMVACAAAEIPLSWATWIDAAEVRGWKAGSKSEVDLMRENGLSDEVIVEELFAILAGAVRRAFDELRP